MTDSRRTVGICVDDDGDAGRIVAVLEALGFEVERVGAGQAWQLARFVARHKLTRDEAELFDRILAGEDHEQAAAALGLSTATTSWRWDHIKIKLAITTPNGARAKARKWGIDA